jgi:signal transduction histidine kinase
VTSGAALPTTPSPARSARTAAAAVALLLPLLLAVLLHAGTQRVAGAAADGVVRLARAERRDVAALAPPSGPAVPDRLPYVELTRAGLPGSAAWFEVPFVLEADARVPYALRATYRPALVVYLDGQLVEQTAPTALLDRGDLRFQVGSRALRVNLPPALLRAGPHAFHVRVGAPGYDGAALSALQFGPAAAIDRLEAADRSIRALRAAVAAAAVVLGTFLVIAWAMVRREWIYGLAGVNCLLVALLLAPALLPEAPLPPVAWRAVLDAADVASKGLTLLLVLVFTGRPIARLAIPAAIALGIAMAIDVAAAVAQRPWSDFSHLWPWWALGVRGLLLAIASAFAVRGAARLGGVSAALSAAAVVLGALLWAYVTGGVLVFGATDVLDLNFVGYGAGVLVVAVLLQRRYVASLNREQDQRAELERLVRVRTGQLESQHAALRESERLRHAQAERERLLQEMHDGLGSRLVAAKISAQRTALAPTDVVRLFDECLQEMRLTVDALSVDDGDLTLLLANFRHRVGPRIADAGLALDWAVGDAPCVPALRGAGGRELLRIVEEALGNVMHHARARRVRIATETDGVHVTVSIADDGSGLPETLSEGRGFANMRARAARLGGALDWGRGPSGGTVVRLRLPLHPAGAS